MNSEPGQIVVIGMGNPLRRDDGVGLSVARRLEALVQPGVKVRIHRGGGLALMDTWQGATTVVVIDAVSSGGQAGTLSRFDASTRPLPQHLGTTCSTHDFGLNEAVELARAVNRLPDRFVVIGVEGADFSPGSGLSPAVDGAVERAVEAVLQELGSLAAPSFPRSEAERA